MSDIRYVCLSDLHFGAENSILTHLAANSVEADPRAPTAVLIGLLECLDALISRNQDSHRPTLILCGDILELALATDNIAAMAFDRFIDLAFNPGHRLFDNRIYFVPGNHDHHLWESAREQQYATYVSSVSPDVDLEIPWHTTRMFAQTDSRSVDAILLSALIHRHPGCADISVQTVYPNLALRTDDGRRCAVVHHGHFLESIYRLMTTVKDMAFPGRPARPDIWDWEAENFAWIDFLWSTLGRSGDAGKDVGLIYASFQSDFAMHRLARNLAAGISARLSGPWLWRQVERRLVQVATDRIAADVGRLERSQPTVVLTPRGEQALRGYIEGPLRRQFAAEHHEPPEELIFIFGHTHKPFEQMLVNTSYTRVDVYNTGGWVVDTLQPVPLQGGAAILLDADLNAVSLRLYNQALDGTPSSVRLAVSDPRVDNPLYRRLLPAVDAGAGWAGFTQAASTLVAERYHDLEVILRLRGELPTDRHPNA